MSVSTELSRLQANRNTIRAKLVEMGIASSVDKLDALAAAIENIVDRGAVQVTVHEGDTYTIPAGYHNGSGTVSGIAGGGNYTLQSKTAVPTKKQQSIVPDDGYYGMSGVTISAIPDNYQDVSSVTAGSGDVLTGKIFVAADGTVVNGDMINNGAVNKTLTATSISYTIPKGYHSGTGKVSIVLEDYTVTPDKLTHTVYPTQGKVFGKITVKPIPDEYIVTSDATAVADNILSGKTAYVNGTKVSGAMTNNGALNKSIDGLTTSEVTIPAGYTSGGTVSLTSDIEEQLAAI